MAQGASATAEATRDYFAPILGRCSTAVQLLEQHVQLLNGIEGQTGQYLQHVYSQLMGVQGFISELSAAQHEAIKGCRAEVAALSEGIEAKIEKLWKHFLAWTTL